MTTPTETPPRFKDVMRAFVNSYSASASDEYREGASESGVRRRYLAAQEAENRVYEWVSNLELQLTAARRDIAALQLKEQQRLGEVANLLSEIGSWRARALELNRVLRKHHEHHQEECRVYFEQDGKPIDICTDLGEAYSESGLAEETVKALAAMQKEAQ